MLEGLYNRLRALGPALLQENRIASGSAAVLERLEKLAATTPRTPESPLLSGGVQEFRSSRDPTAVYRVTFGRAGRPRQDPHLDRDRQRTEALAATQEAVDIQRRLAQTRPDASCPTLRRA
jgi:hypothetical protein